MYHVLRYSEAQMEIRHARIRSKPLCRLLTGVLIAASGLRGDVPTTPKTYDITFAQFTDAHVFDDGWKLSSAEALKQAANDRTALSWAIDQVNRAVAGGMKIDFVVYTGDLGLQNVAFEGSAGCRALALRVEPGLPASTLASAASEVVSELNRLQVRTIFLVPGNNDIQDENVTDQRFDCFLAELQQRARSLPDPLMVDALRADRTIDVNGIRLAGLNSASFKAQSNYTSACSKSTPSAGDSGLNGSCPQPQLEALRKLVEDDPKAPVILFTHVPDLIDPYFHKTHPGVRKSAWDLPNDLRSVWEREICQPTVIGIFAGHFHDANTAVYGSNSTTKDLAYTTCVAQKTWVAPPLALKNQERMLAKARGFLLAHVAAGTVAEVQLKWFDGPAAAARAGDLTGNPGSSAASDRGATSSGSPLLPTAWLALTFFGAVALSVVLGRIGQRDLTALSSALAGVVLVVTVIWFARSQLGVTESATLIALMLCPLLVYGVASGRLTEFSGPGGWGAKFGQIPIAREDYSAAPVDVTGAQDIPKSSLPETLAQVQKMQAGKPAVLTLKVGGPTPGGYTAQAVATALRNLTQYPNFKFVVFLNADSRLIAYVPGWRLLLALDANTPDSVNFINALNTNSVNSAFPGLLTATVLPETSNAKALEEMERWGLDAIPVVDPATGQLLGVVERERILSRMLMRLAKGGRAKSASH